MFLWAVAIAGVCVACAAWVRAGKTARKLDALTQSYWELRYDFTRLRSQVARLDPEPAEVETPAPQPPAAGASYISLDSMKVSKKKG